jgi:hypothetical protein
MLDYEEFLLTNDIIKSQQKAYDISKNIFVNFNFPSTFSKIVFIVMFG